MFLRGRGETTIVIEAIVFDMGGVFFKKSETLRNRVFKEYRLSEDWLEEIKRLPSYHAYKEGQISQDDFMSQVDALLTPGREPAQNLFRDLSLARELNQRLVALTQRLGSRYRTAVLSNSDSFLEERLQYFGVWDLFEFVINSYRVRMRKPDPRIFHHLLYKIALEPEKILFIDDKASNVIVAQDLGMHGHVFSNNADLTRHLAKEGILI